MRYGNKKERELQLVIRMRDLQADGPAGFVCLQEEPDFLVNTAHGLLGIEQ